jgi:type IV secretion system protein VirB5
MKKQLTKIAIFSSLLIASINSNAIVVFDPTAAGNAVKSIIEAKNQIIQLKNQVEQARNTFKSINGTRGIVNLLQDPLVIGKMPKQYQDLYSDIKSQTGGKWKDLYTLSANGKDTKNMKSVDFKQAYDALLLDNNERINKAFINSNARLNGLSVLADKIAGTKDPKEIADLQARIGAEQGAIALDGAKFEMLKQLNEMKLNALKENSHNQFMASLDKPYKLPEIHMNMHKPFSK